MSKAIQILRHAAKNKALLSSPLTKFYAKEVDKRTSEVLDALMSANDQEIDFALLITSDVDELSPAKEVSPEPVIEEETPNLDEQLDEFDTRLDDRLRERHDDEVVDEARSDEMASLVEDIDIEEEKPKRPISECPEFQREVAEAQAEFDAMKALEPEPQDAFTELLEKIDNGTFLKDKEDKEPEPESDELNELDEIELDEDDLDLDSLLEDLEG
ncbi:hypothetical protein KI655_18525 [Vibrio sp. D404a]|uniref:hypothetical protein n=1 Tax=unclassified Vibrio TaxID=2614977 RepID=UPI002556D5DD|nr:MULTISPECIES: hypothetical protein [unclassified Vibrio]MDK9739294.1 hypothetical protein [Vibrio sp. D404a]MDK9797670.1 hypothetical protein [Vibrio sp. D449a]